MKVHVDIKLVMTDQEKIAEQQLVGTLMKTDQKKYSQVNFYNIYILLFLTIHLSL